MLIRKPSYRGIRLEAPFPLGGVTAFFVYSEERETRIIIKCRSLSLEAPTGDLHVGGGERRELE